MFLKTVNLWETVPGLCKETPTLDIYVPEHQTSDIAVVILPGGGYGMRAEHEGKGYAEFLNEQGIAAFVCQYRVNPHLFPLPLMDARRAVQYVRHYRDTYGICKDKVYIMGSSAGGHLAAHYSNYYHCKEVRELFPESKKVAACLLGYPVITADPNYCHRGSIEKLAGYFPIKKEDMPKFSCEYQVTENTPPTFIWHTAEDAAVPVQNSLFYANALSKCCVPFEMHIYPYGCHGRSTADMQSCKEIEPGMEYLHDWINAAVKWLKAAFKMP